MKAQQARIDRAGALVVVFPVYWRSMPAIIKAWTDRVFIGGGNHEGDDTHRYCTSFATQIEHGIFRFCGLRRVTTHLLLEAQGGNAAIRGAHLKAAYAAGAALRV